MIVDRCENCGRPLSEAEVAFGARRCAFCSEAQIEATASAEVPAQPAPVLGDMWSRVAASVIDSIVGSVGSLAVAAGIGLTVRVYVYLSAGPYITNTEQDRANAIGLAVGLLAFFLAYGAYHVLGNASGGTPAKKWLSLRVVDAKSGGPISLGRSFLRWIVWYVGSLPLYLGWLWAIWDKQSQAWHDKAARTLVVQTPAGQVAAQSTSRLYARPWFIPLGLTVTALAVAFSVGLVLFGRRDIRYEPDRTGATSHPVEVGDCVTFDPGVVDIVVPCFGAHDAVVTSVLELPEQGYPGEAAIVDYAETQCPDDRYSYPRATRWALGARQIICFSDAN
jgi:uncharacterized RDD family membrane protein YckC